LSRSEDLDDRGTGVFLRGIETTYTETLVPEEGPDTVHPEASTPNFYKNTIIYVRSNCLWQIDRSGSNNTRLFPAP